MSSTWTFYYLHYSDQYDFKRLEQSLRTGLGKGGERKVEEHKTSLKKVIDSSVWPVKFEISVRHPDRSIILFNM